MKKDLLLHLSLGKGMPTLEITQQHQFISVAAFVYIKYISPLS
jgi:hypothetical protein